MIASKTDCPVFTNDTKISCCLFQIKCHVRFALTRTAHAKHLNCFYSRVLSRGISFETEYRYCKASLYRCIFATFETGLIVLLTFEVAINTYSDRINLFQMPGCWDIKWSNYSHCNGFQYVAKTIRTKDSALFF